MRSLLFIVVALSVSCGRREAANHLLTKHLRYSAYTWRLDADTLQFYLSHSLQIDQDGHFVLMRHDSIMDIPKFRSGEIEQWLSQEINETLPVIRPKDVDSANHSDHTFIYDGFTYCLDYQLTDSTPIKIDYIPTHTIASLAQLSKYLDLQVVSNQTKEIQAFDITQYTKELANFSLRNGKMLPRREKPNVEIKK